MRTLLGVGILITVVAVTAPVLAQTQGHPQHPQGQPHNPNHPAMDPALHALLHGRLSGSWSGTLTRSDAVPTKLDLAIATDKKGQLTLTMKNAGPVKAGAATNVQLDETGLRWAQPVSGQDCKAKASLDPVTHHGPETMKGTMMCGTQEMAFVMTKAQR